MTKYSYQDINTKDKPRILKRDRKFGNTIYHYVCSGRSSKGYGYTPEHAYKEWQRNWNRRMEFYGTREKNAQQVIDNVTSKQPEVHKTLACRRCGIEGLHWETFQNGYRLFSADGELHKCNAPDPVTSK